MAVALVNVPDIPIVGTGTYPLASGTTTFAAEDLADAVRAAQDPTVPAPRIKIGHNDARFDQAIASGELDGEPAFGTVQNMRLSPNGQEIIGDLVDVPAWLADTMRSSYPGRSIEGAFAFHSRRPARSTGSRSPASPCSGSPGRASRVSRTSGRCSSRTARRNSPCSPRRIS